MNADNTPALGGVLTALVTPMRAGRIDEQALIGLIQTQRQAGVDALVACGSTGESGTLSPDEQGQVIAVAAAHRAPEQALVAGVGGSATAKVVALAKQAERLGATALLAVSPYYVRPTAEGIAAHFRALADATALPIIVYNIPSRTGVDIDLPTLARLAEIPTVVAIKESSGNVLRAQQIVAALGPRLTVLAGDDANTLPTLAVGGAGVVSVTANLLPDRVVAVVRAWQHGDPSRAQALHLALLPVHDAMFLEANPGPVKAALAERGDMCAELRLPLVPPRAETLTALRATLRDCGL